MASGYRSGGVDFDDLFDPYVQGTKPAATGRRVAGVDLNQRYAPIVFGSKRADVGTRVNGVDVSNLWAAKGSAAYITAVMSNRMSITGAAMSASIAVLARTNGSLIFTADQGGSVNYHYPLAAGVGSQYQISISGNVTGYRNTGSSASLKGQGGVDFTAAVAPGNTGNFDTGWIEMSDSLNVLTAAANSPPNAGAGSVDGNMIVRVRRKSDNEIVRTFDIAFTCLADSQS